jgi:5-oxoprolinase (ATP-hydrolysing)
MRSAAVVLLHSYLYPRHEEIVAELAREIGFTQISLSSKVMPMIKMVPRGYTTCVDAYLTPVIRVSLYMSPFCTANSIYLH